MIQSAHSTVIANDQSLNPAFQVLMSGQADIIFEQVAIKQSMDLHFDRLQIEMKKNSELQEQLLQLHKQMDAKQHEVHQMQQQFNTEVLKHQQEMLQLQ